MQSLQHNFILALQNLGKSYFGLPFFIYIRNIHSINELPLAFQRNGNGIYRCSCSAPKSWLTQLLSLLREYVYLIPDISAR